MKITEEYIIKLAKAYALYAFRSSTYPSLTDEYWKKVFIELNKVKIQIVEGE